MASRGGIALPVVLLVTALLGAHGCSASPGLETAYGVGQDRAGAFDESARLADIDVGLLAALVHKEMQLMTSADDFSELAWTLGARTFGISQVHTTTAAALLQDPDYSWIFDELQDDFPPDTIRGSEYECALGAHLHQSEEFAIRAAAAHIRQARDRIAETLEGFGVGLGGSEANVTISPAQYDLFTIMAYRSDWEYWAGPQGTLQTNAGPDDVKERLLNLYRPGGTSEVDREHVLDVLAAAGAEPDRYSNIVDTYGLDLEALPFLMDEARYFE